MWDVGCGMMDDGKCLPFRSPDSYRGRGKGGLKMSYFKPRISILPQPQPQPEPCLSVHRLPSIVCRLPSTVDFALFPLHYSLFPINGIRSHPDHKSQPISGSRERFLATSTFSPGKQGRRRVSDRPVFPEKPLF